MKPIVLYDVNHERVGETYPRRAKQLLRSGRALWLEEDVSMTLILAQDIPTPPTKEDAIIMTEPLLTNDGVAMEVESVAPPITTSDDLLMYVAKQNIDRKRSLFRHVAAFVMTLVLLTTIDYVFVSEDSLTAHSSNPVLFRDVVDLLGFAGVDNLRGPANSTHYSLRGPGGFWSVLYNNNGSTDFHWIDGQVVVDFSNAAHFFDQSIGIIPASHTTFNFRHFALGVMLTWGLWIAIRGVKVTRVYLQGREPKSARPDPVTQEYQRLRAQIL